MEWRSRMKENAQNKNGIEYNNNLLIMSILTHQIFGIFPVYF